ncbi:MAG: hypothetical protein J2P53_00840 [Bradyrhizobiaceae bacterium]|nr:hypothetical protein [Bradyrhizobiaceae bacterium]
MSDYFARLPADGTTTAVTRRQAELIQIAVLHLLRHSGQVLRGRAHRILPDTGDFRLKQRACRLELDIEPRQSPPSVSIRGVIMNICLKPVCAISARSEMAPSATPRAKRAVREHHDLGQLARPPGTRSAVPNWK